MPVVLLHGNGTMAEDFRASGIFQELAKAHRVIAFDRPGFGYSERPRERIWSPAAQARLLASALDGLGIDRCIVVGHSWGTLVALTLASEHPQRVQGLVLISGYYFASFRWDAVASIGGALPIIGDVLHYTLSPTIGRRLLRRALKKQFAPKPIAAAFLRRFPVELILRPWQMRASAEENAIMVPAAAALAPRYKSLHTPVAIVAGEGDEIVESRKQSERLGKKLPNSITRLVPGSGHMLHYAIRDDIVEAVRLVERIEGFS
jgi:pimeloyl-ACP methyl ester carboxylesterase